MTDLRTSRYHVLENGVTDDGRIYARNHEASCRTFAEALKILKECENAYTAKIALEKHKAKEKGEDYFDDGYSKTYEISVTLTE
jgi:hypothetical protein